MQKINKVHTLTSYIDKIIYLSNASSADAWHYSCKLQKWHKYAIHNFVLLFKIFNDRHYCYYNRQ